MKIAIRCVLFLVYIFVVLCGSLNAITGREYGIIAKQIAGRAQILHDRVISFDEKQSSKTPALYYVILSFLEDIHTLYLIGDNDSAHKRLLILDLITYDLITTGYSTALSVNEQVGKLQKSMFAGSLKEFKKIVEQRLDIVSQRGLEESIHFVPTEDRYCAFLFNQLINLQKKIKDINSPSDIKQLFASFSFGKYISVRYQLPESVYPPETQYIFSLKFDNQNIIQPVLMFKNQAVPRITLLLAVEKILAYYTGLTTHNNESYESQLHYLVLEMRYLDWLDKNKRKFSIKKASELKRLIQWYRGSFEGLVGESFVPQYYDQLLAGKYQASCSGSTFDWQKTKQSDQINIDDYLYAIQGNRSQLPPDKTLIDYLDMTAQKLPVGSAYMLGCGEGRNLPELLKYKNRFKQVIAIDHSSLALKRLEQLQYFGNTLDKVHTVCDDIVSFSYPNKQTPLLQRPNLILLIHVIEYLSTSDRITLFSKLRQAICSNGQIFIAVHLAEGPFFDKLKDTEQVRVTGSDSIVENKYFGPQTKHFFKRGELENELSKAGIHENKFELSSTYLSNDFGYNIGVIVVKKKQIESK